MKQPNQSMSRRNFLRLSGASAVTLAIAACAAPTAAPSGDGEAGATADTIQLRVQGNPDNEQPLADLFMENNSNVDIEYISVTGIDHEEVASKILSLVAAGEQFDIGFAATEATQLYAGQGLADALDDYVERDSEEMQEYFSDVHPSLVEAMMWEGSLYELPRDFNAANMYYNVGLFEEAGFDHPSPDWTWEEWVDIARTIAGGEGADQRFGYAWTNRLWGSWMPWIFVNESNLLTEEKAPGGEWLWGSFYEGDAAAEGRGGGFRWTAPQANNEANVRALELMQELTQEGTAPATELGSGETLQGFFTAGRLGMTPAGGFWAGGLHNAGMEPGTFDVQLMPRWESQRHQFGTGGKFMFAQGENKDMVWEFLKMEVSIPAYEVSGLYNPVVLTTPARRSRVNAEAFADTGPEHWEVFYSTLDDYPDTGPIPAPPISNPMTNIFTTNTGLAMTFELTAQEALDKMQSELEELYARSGEDMYVREG